MEAIRQTIKVENHEIKITLPNDFNSEEVDVIIMPSSKNHEIPIWQIEEVRKRTINYFKNPEMTLDFDKTMAEIENGL